MIYTPRSTLMGTLQESFAVRGPHYDLVAESHG